MSFIALLFALGAAMSIGTGFVFVGRALTESYPESVWDWYVVVICIAYIAAMYPTMTYFGIRMAERELGS